MERARQLKGQTKWRRNRIIAFKKKPLGIQNI
jgi:hypothetical protein